MTQAQYPPRNTDSPAMKVKPERTEWRDKDYSKRHREWSPELTMTDVDALEFNCRTNEPVALIELKKDTAVWNDPKEPSNLAQIALAERAGVPMFGVRYSHDLSWYYVAALSSHAKRLLPDRIRITEKAYERFLLWLRGPKKSVALETADGGTYRTPEAI